jgi:hypothetical protein
VVPFSLPSLFYSNLIFWGDKGLKILHLCKEKTAIPRDSSNTIQAVILSVLSRKKPRIPFLNAIFLFFEAESAIFHSKIPSRLRAAPPASSPSRSKTHPAAGSGPCGR